MTQRSTTSTDDQRRAYGLDSLRACADEWLQCRSGDTLAAVVCVAVAWPQPGEGAGPDAAAVSSLMTRLQGLAEGAGMAARDGDDQLVLFLPAPRTLNHAERVTQQLLRGVPADGPAVVAGIAHCPGHGTGFESLLKRARRALGEAQLEGDRDYRVYSPL